jgi:hypothetical protein
MSSTPNVAPEPRRRHVGPPLVPLGLVGAVLFIASLVVGASGGGPFPSPYDDETDIYAFFSDHATTVRVSATLQFASAVPLAILAVSLSSRLRYLGFSQVPGVLIASMGGILASSMVALSALVQWVLSRPDVAANHAIVRPLVDLSFAIGGPGVVVFLGLLLAGVAVPAAFGRLLPRPVVIVGLLLAVAGELGTIALLTKPAGFLIPIARFGGLAWLIAVAALIPARRPSTSAAPGAEVTA